MNGRFLLTGTAAAALTLFAWQTVSNTAIPWHTATMRAFQNNDAAVRAIRAQAPENGVYFSPQGVLAAVAFTPDLADKTRAMGGMLGRQLLIDLGAAFVLSLVVLRLAASSPLGVAVTLGLAGLATAGISQLSDWNWYGFAPSYAIVNTVDLTINLFLAGLVLGALKRRELGSDLAITDEAPAVRAGGRLPSPVEQPARKG